MFRSNSSLVTAVWLKQVKLKQYDTPSFTLCSVSRTPVMSADSNGGNKSKRRRSTSSTIIPCSFSLPHVTEPYGNLLTPIPYAHWADAGHAQTDCNPHAHWLNHACYHRAEREAEDCLIPATQSRSVYLVGCKNVFRDAVKCEEM